MAGNTNYTEMLRRGTILRGIYRIEDYLASGGFGNTYVVTHTELGERFAIKEFYMKGVSERGEDSTTVRVSNTQNRSQFESQRTKFKKEALRLRKMQNPHIVRVHDLFEENGTAYYVMDLIEGQSLSAHLKQMGHPMSELEARHILPQVLDALATVHSTGFQHLDLKPANIMMDARGNVSLIDFGASKQLDLDDSGASTSSAMAYTPGYAPSEQVQQNLKKLGPWTDLYALGATLYNLVSNQRPPQPSDIEDDGAAAFLFPKGVSQDFRDLVLWLMAPRRTARPQSVAEVQRRLQPDVVDVLTPDGGEDVTVTDSHVDGRRIEDHVPPTPPPNRHLRLIIMSVVIALAVSLGAGLSIAFLRGCGDNPSTDEEPVTETAQPQSATNQSFTNAVMGTYSYTGQLDSDGQPHDTHGRARLANGDVYEGEFQHGVFQGEGTYSYSEGDRFIGTFRNNQFAKGTYTTADGDQFTGTFKDGQPDKGTWK